MEIDKYETNVDMHDLAITFEHLLSDAFGDGFYNWPANLFRCYITEGKDASDYEAMGRVRGLIQAALIVLKTKKPKDTKTIETLQDKLMSCSVCNEEETINEVLQSLRNKIVY